jgi:hypothetical protein
MGMIRGSASLAFLALGLIAAGAACTRKAPEAPEMTIQLFSGIRDFVRLGDTEGDVKRFTRFPFVQEEVPVDPPTATLRAVDVTHLYHFKEAGTKIYFREGRVVLIEIQEPFKGVIQGKGLKLFQFELRQDKSWADLIERELGTSVARGSGGRFGAEALYYPWGDISYNRMGPNEVALYTDPAISLYRQKNFGREIRLFK